MNGDSFNLTKARADEDQMEDMFFTGGDLNNQGFLAWKWIEQLKITLDLAFNNVKPKDWYFVLD